VSSANFSPFEPGHEHWLVSTVSPCAIDETKAVDTPM